MRVTNRPSENLDFMADPWSPVTAWETTMTTVGPDDNLWVVAGSLDFKKIPMGQLYGAVPVPVSE